MKGLQFLGSSHSDLLSFPKSARQRIGRQLNRVQQGRDPEDWKPMPSVGQGVREIRIRVEGDAYRSIYVTQLADAVHVLHVFAKKTRKTPRRDIEIARSRLKALKEQLMR